MAAATVYPAFFPEDERWVRTTTPNGSILVEAAKAAKARARFDLVCMLRTFSAETWRHQIEKQEGEMRLWQAITAQRAWWINDVGLAPATEARKSSEPTRWQEHTMQLFSLLLLPPDQAFDMRDDQHLMRLARLLRKAEEDKDEQLAAIIRYFFTTV